MLLTQRSHHEAIHHQTTAVLFLPWFPKNEAESLTSLPNSWCVNEWGHLFDVLCYHFVEELLISVHQRRQVDVLIQVFRPATNIGKHSVCLLFSREYSWWQKAMDTQDLSLLQSEGHTL